MRHLLTSSTLRKPREMNAGVQPAFFVSGLAGEVVCACCWALHCRLLSSAWVVLLYEGGILTGECGKPLRLHPREHSLSTYGINWAH